MHVGGVYKVLFKRHCCLIVTPFVVRLEVGGDIAGSICRKQTFPFVSGSRIYIAYFYGNTTLGLGKYPCTTHMIKHKIDCARQNLRKQNMISHRPILSLKMITGYEDNH
jgi:hypothetical protein